MKNNIGVNVNDYISLINAPTEDKPFYRSYSVSYLATSSKADRLNM